MYSQEQLIEKLHQFCQLPVEIEWLEFKEAAENFGFDDLGRYFSGLSNEADLKNKHSAWLIFGIKDKYPRKIVGTHFRRGPHKLNNLKHEISTHTNGVSFQEKVR